LIAGMERMTASLEADPVSELEQLRSYIASLELRLNNSRRAFMHILNDAHATNVRLGQSRKAMIHIMGDLRQTTEEMSAREQELREKQEQLVQAAKLATLGELTTGVAHELNNPLNNIGLYIGNVLDMLESDSVDRERVQQNLKSAMGQVSKATEIISHLRTFGRAAPTTHESVRINDVILSSVALLKEQFRLREIVMEVNLAESNPRVMGNAIQLEQVLMNLLTNARDAVNRSLVKRVSISSIVDESRVRVTVEDSGPGIPTGMEQRIFDPFFTTKEVGEGTGLGLSIVYGIIRDHEGTISVQSKPGACFVIELPLSFGRD
jgi:C4-dicarboxylate-specific signal transduction histidine kinase